MNLLQLPNTAWDVIIDYIRATGNSHDLIHLRNVNRYARAYFLRYFTVVEVTIPMCSVNPIDVFEEGNARLYTGFCGFAYVTGKGDEPLLWPVLNEERGFKLPEPVLVSQDHYVENYLVFNHEGNVRQLFHDPDHEEHHPPLDFIEVHWEPAIVTAITVVGADGAEERVATQSPTEFMDWLCNTCSIFRNHGSKGCLKVEAMTAYPLLDENARVYVPYNGMYEFDCLTKKEMAEKLLDHPLLNYNPTVPEFYDALLEQCDATMTMTKLLEQYSDNFHDHKIMEVIMAPNITRILRQCLFSQQRPDTRFPFYGSVICGDATCWTPTFRRLMRGIQGGIAALFVVRKVNEYAMNTISKTVREMTTTVRDMWCAPNSNLARHVGDVIKNTLVARYFKYNVQIMCHPPFFDTHLFARIETDCEL